MGRSGVTWLQAAVVAVAAAGAARGALRGGGPAGMLLASSVAALVAAKLWAGGVTAWLNEHADLARWVAALGHVPAHPLPLPGGGAVAAWPAEVAVQERAGVFLGVFLAARGLLGELVRAVPLGRGAWPRGRALGALAGAAEALLLSSAVVAATWEMQGRAPGAGLEGGFPGAVLQTLARAVAGWGGLTPPQVR